MNAAQQKADALFAAGETQFCAALTVAEAIADPDARQKAFAEARRVWDLQREYQRKVRHGEVQP